MEVTVNIYKQIDIYITDYEKPKITHPKEKKRIKHRSSILTDTIVIARDILHNK